MIQDLLYFQDCPGMNVPIKGRLYPYQVFYESHQCCAWLCPFLLMEGHNARWCIGLEIYFSAHSKIFGMIGNTTTTTLLAIVFAADIDIRKC